MPFVKESPKAKMITPSPAVLADLARKDPDSPLAKRLFAQPGSVPPTVLAASLDVPDDSAAPAVAVDVTPTPQALSDDSGSRQEDVFVQLARQQLLMDKMAASQAAIDKMIATLHAAVTMLTSALSSGSAPVIATWHVAGADGMFLLMGMPPISLYPLLRNRGLLLQVLLIALPMRRKVPPNVFLFLLPTSGTTPTPTPMSLLMGMPTNSLPLYPLLFTRGPLYPTILILGLCPSVSSHRVSWCKECLKPCLCLCLRRLERRRP
jgi:hypothetical protein